MMILIGKSQRNNTIFYRSASELSPVYLNELRKDKEVNKYESIIKYWHTVSGIIGDKFHFIEPKKKFFCAKKERNRQERRYKAATVTEENEQNY